MAVVLAIPDIHEPFSHKDYLAFLKAVAGKYRPGRVVCLGDELDHHALGNWEHDPNGYSAGHEFIAGRNALRGLWKLFPRGQSCISNHTSRPVRLATKAGLPSVFLREYRDVLGAPKAWSWVESVEIDGVKYLHGEGFSGPLGALKCALGHMQSVVIGHLHSHAGVLWSGNEKHLIFGFNVGCLLDRHAYAFAYGKHHTAKPILGCGIIRDGIPTFVPMLLTRRGRWTGKL